MTQDFSFWEFDALGKFWDICIIGSGINGISAGISILEKDPSKNVLIVDRWFIPLGASTRNAGFSCFGSPSEIIEDISVMGEANALALVQRRWKGLAQLRTRLQGSNAQYETFGGYELYREGEYHDVVSRLPYLNDLLQQTIGIKEVFHVIDVPEGIRGFFGAIHNPHEGQLHPVHMMEHLKEKFISSGGKLWTGYNVEEIREHGDHVEISNHLSIPITAAKVIVTTNAYTQQLLPELDVHGARNQVLVTEPIGDLKWKGCFHYDKGFYYFRNIGNRILLGGGRNLDFNAENTDQLGTNPYIVEQLEAFLYDHLADRSVGIPFRWSGIIAVGNSKMPIVQKVSDRILAGVRCSGMGIAMASVTGEELAQMALQQ